jgi:hypothetical protein
VRSQLIITAEIELDGDRHRAAILAVTLIGEFTDSQVARAIGLISEEGCGKAISLLRVEDVARLTIE